jgi:hypothetical protein
MTGDAPESPSELGRRLVCARRQVKGICRVCGNEFVGAANKRYCGAKCRWHYYRHRQREAMLSLDYRVGVVYQGSARVFLDAEGYYWLQLVCLQGPAEGDPDRPATPETLTLDASYYARFRAFASEERRPRMRE